VPAAERLNCYPDLQCHILKKGVRIPIYRWHVFVMAIGLKFTLKLMIVRSYLLTMAIQAAIILPIIFFFSVTLFLAVEKPCMEPEWPNMLRSFLRDLWRKEAVSVAAVEIE
jgi:peptidoglycan/LPS O-acetylase OafA/YrhL